MPPDYMMHRENLDRHIATLTRVIETKKLLYALKSPESRAEWERQHNRGPFPQVTPWERLEHTVDRLYAIRERLPTRDEMQQGAQTFAYDPASQSYSFCR